MFVRILKKFCFVIKALDIILRFNYTKNAQLSNESTGVRQRLNAKNLKRSVAVSQLLLFSATFSFSRNFPQLFTFSASFFKFRNFLQLSILIYNR